MKVTTLDFRHRAKDILTALDHNEPVTFYYRGKPRGVMYPIGLVRSKKEIKIADLPAVGIWEDREDMADVGQYVRNLRKGRFNVD